MIRGTPVAGEHADPQIDLVWGDVTYTNGGSNGSFQIDAIPGPQQQTEGRFSATVTHDDGGDPLEITGAYCARYLPAGAD